MGNGLPRVKIVTEEGRFNTTRCFVDEREVKFITGIETEIRPGQVPQFTIETVGLPDIDMRGQVLFSFAPQTIEDAAKVLQYEFQTNPESYKALVSSIESVLKEMSDKEELCDSDVAKSIANRILGIE